MSIFNELKWLAKKSQLSSIKLIVFDVDGVLTDGGLFYDDKGNIQKKFNVKDGLGIKILQRLGLKIALISGGASGATEKRAENLNIDFCFTEIPNKSKKINEIQNNLNISPRETLFLGDDINDLVVKPFISLLVAPRDSNYFYKKRADLILKNNGGNGAVRELAERMVKSLNLLDSFDLEWKEKND